MSVFGLWKRPKKRLRSRDLSIQSHFATLDWDRVDMSRAGEDPDEWGPGDDEDDDGEAL